MSLIGAYLGGVRHTASEWIGLSALLVRFETLHDDCVHHVYVGRRLSAVASAGSRSVVVPLLETEWPQPITIVAQDAAYADRDVGDDLPPRPWNATRLIVTAEGATWADAKTIEVRSGEFPGDPADDDFERARTVYQGEGTYTIEVPPLPGAGHWGLEVVGRDKTLPTGNVGSTATVTVRVECAPPDLVLQADGERFAVAVAGGVASIDCEVP